MKKITTLLVLLLAISSMTWAQNSSSVVPSDLSSTPHTDVIGTDTTTSRYFPSYSHINYSLSQQIYYASEFDAISIGDTIVKIGFQLGAMPVNRYWNIYITTTNQASLSDGFIQISPNDLAWSGTTASMTANAWNEITLYSGTVFNGSNILVTFQDVTGTWTWHFGGANQGIVTATGISGISRIKTDDFSETDPTRTIHGGNAYADRLNMRFVSGNFNVNRDGDFIFSDRAKTHLIRYTGAGGNITIPSTVTTIGGGAFSACSGLTSVTIPNSVTSIGDGVFSGCRSLTSISIPNSVTSIGNSAFYKCVGLTSISIPNSVTSIGNSAFYECEGLTSVTIPNSVTSIGDYAFYGCNNLTSVTIPNSVTSIGDYAFYGCNNLTSVTIPNSVTSIGDYTFYGCYRLTSVTLGNSVTTIGDYAFYNCDGLTSVTLGNSVTTIGDYAFYYCDGLTSVTIPNSVTSIGHLAFYLVKYVSYCGTAAGAPWGARYAGCGDFIFSDNTMTTLVGYVGAGGSITIPNTVVTIGDSVFYNRSDISSVSIPNTVTSIGDYAFYDCDGLASVAIPDAVTSIGDYAFWDCDGLASVAIPNAVTTIGNYTFYNCSELTSVTIGNHVVTIGNYAFAYCPLTSVSIPNSVTTIGNYTFSNCSELTSVTIGNHVVTIGNSAFYYCPLTSVSIPNSVTTIGNRAFGYCSSLTSITIPNSVTTIGDSVFYYCSRLASVTIPNSVTTIGDYAFSYCSSLTSVTIPNSVTTIGDYAFSSCSSLTSVTIGNSVTSIGNYAFNRALFGSSPNSIFLGCTTPPQIQQTTFNASATHPVTFHIPCNTTETYRNTAIWNRAYYQYVEDMGCPTQVVVVANDTTLGTVTGGGTYLTGQTVTLTATAKPNCHFVAWQDGNSQNPRTITIDSNDTYLTFTAIFVVDTYFVVTVVSNDANMGTVSGGGRYLSGSTATLSATPMNDCRFVQWSDGNRSNPRTLRVAGNTTLMAIFRVNPDTIYVPVHDTTLVPYPVHDTTFVPVHDTTWLSYPVHDTTYITLHDTTMVPYPVHDTTYITVRDTTWLPYPVHDTTYIAVHDTTWLPYPVYDTTYITLHDTTMVPYPVYDTTFITIHDTIVMHDTVGSRITYYELSVISGNNQRGVVAGSGRFPDSTMVEIAAIPIEGNRFLQWQDGNSDNPRTVHLLGANATFVATFEPSTQDIATPQSDDDVAITTHDGQITVSNVANRTVRLFDSVGRLLSTSNTPDHTRVFTLPTSGLYLLQVGTAPARRVVVVR